MKSLWRCQSNDLVPSVLLSSFSPSSDAPPPLEKRDNFLNFTLFCKALSMELYSPAQVIFPLSEQRGAGGWTQGDRGPGVGGSGDG